MKKIVFLIMILLALSTIPNLRIEKAEAELKTYSIDSSTNEYVDLMYLAARPEEFENQSVTTIGTVRFYASIYMFEDFWLQASNDVKIPVVTRFAGLSVPLNASLIEISGTIKHSTLEGGFYFLSASSWITVNATPEFSSTVILVLSLIIFSVSTAIIKVKSMQKPLIWEESIRTKHSLPSL